MKNLLLFIGCLPVFLQAQSTCRGYIGDEVFQANRIGAVFSPQGGKFADYDYGFFKAPYTSDQSPGTIYASAPWIGGFRDGELKVAGSSFGFSRQDYYTGPLGPGASTYPNLCNYFENIWDVTRTQIEAHLEDVADGMIEDTIPAIFGWPAQGNIFFNQFNGFALPADHNGGWADFEDQNLNGVYEPHQGEYPLIRLKGLPYIPEQIFWMVFNDQGVHEQSGGDPLGVEIQLTVYGFNCENNSVLNTTLFNSYKILNQGGIALDSVYFGMWTDYDLGCSSDDFVGCDSLRHTEFVYNDEEDGDIQSECSIGGETYGQFPPVQSMTYLSHPMHSFLADGLHPAVLASGPEYPEESYNLLSGKWKDGIPITPDSSGYNPGFTGNSTRYLYHGDPRDSLQWSWYQEGIKFGDPRPVSSVYLSTLEPNEFEIVETAYIFHQDSSLDHLEHFGLMYANIDSLFKLINDSTLSCVRSAACYGRDCVWPGDFNHNGIADHFDILYWGVMKDNLGGKRNGRINWDGHSADPWTLSLPGDLNAKHGDGNGNGIVNDEDLDRNIRHYLFTNPYYEPQALYPEGPEIILASNQLEPNGAIRNFSIRAGQDIPGVLGLAYEIEFDTTLFSLVRLLSICPADSGYLSFNDEIYSQNSPFVQTSNAYSFVKTDHQSLSIEEGFTFQRTFGSTAFALRPELSPGDIPDSTIIRLKNLIAIDANGNDLQIGANQLVLTKTDIVGIEDPSPSSVHVFPNPSDGFISIHTDVETSVEIFTIQGRKIMDLTASDIRKPVDVSALPSGIYVLRVMASGESIKLIID